MHTHTHYTYSLEERISLLEKNEAQRVEHDKKQREDMKELKDRLDQLSVIATKYDEIKSIVNRYCSAKVTLI